MFRVRKEIDGNIIVRNLFRLNEENEAVKHRIIRYIRNFFGLEKKEQKLLQT